VLRGHGIPHCGSGENLTAAEEPVWLDVAGLRVALLGYTCLYLPGWEATDERPGVAAIRVRTLYEPPARVLEQPGTPPIVRTFVAADELERVQNHVRRARAGADVVIVSVHWGVSEKYRLLAEYQVSLGRAFVDAGADVVFGHHPHVIQGFEVYKGRPILYSLGNFAFDLDLPSYFDDEGLIAWASFTGRQLSGCALIPIRINAAHEPVPCDDDEARAILGRLRAMAGEHGARASETRLAGRLALALALG
ncbi:MAG TPA: CapA family protein, partial [Bacillota bacterium]